MPSLPPTPTPTPPSTAPTPGVARATRVMVAQVTALARRPALVLLVAGLVALLSVALASRLSLRTSFVELLPTQDPAVKALERTKSRVSDLSLLLVGIRSPDRAANLRYAEALTAHLRRLPPTVCELAAYHIKDLQAFFHDHRWLYPSVAELTEVRDELKASLVRRKNPFALDLSDDPAPAAGGQPAGPTREERLRARLGEAARKQQGFVAERFPDGYFVRGDYAWVATLPAGGMVAERAGDALIAEVRAFVARHPPASYHPQMVVQTAGPVQSAIQNREAVERDILSVTVVCVLVISLSIVLYFRSKRWLLIVVAPAALGTVMAFAVAALAIGYLNSSTAFLGSILLGNGINYPLVLLARYRERRDLGEGPEVAMAEAVSGVWLGTLAAALAAAAAYASLTLTSFRGFSQFGLMGALGCVFCWATTFTVLPPLARLAERRAPREPLAAPPSSGWGQRFDRLQHEAWSRLAALIAEQPRKVVLAALALTLVSGLGLRHFLDAPFEFDFRKLSTDSDRTEVYKQFDRNLNDVFGIWHSPTVLLADRLDQVVPMREAIRRKDAASSPPERRFIGQIVTIYDVLPGTPEQQAEKLALLADIRRLASDPAVELLDEGDRRLLRENLPPAGLRALAPADLPPLAQRPFTERDGSVGRALLAYHNLPKVSMWNGRDLLGIASVLARLELPDGSVIESSGPPMIFGGMLRSILRDGPLATGLSFLAVVLIVSVFMRPLRAAVLAVGGLLVGVVWMVGAAGHLGVRITFLNFIALPITFGVGVEYAVNVTARLFQEREPSQAVQSTGGAVALCSWTTIVGYGSLMAANSRALRGYGAMAILGEVACLLAAVLVLPAALSWSRQRTRRPRTAAGTATP